MALLTAFALAAATPTRLPPVERCTGDAAFDRTRAELVRAVKARDVEGLLALMSDRVLLSFGGRGGKAQFREFWSREPEQRVKLWATLDDILTLGCVEQVDGMGRTYRAMPAMFKTAEDLDGFTTLVSRPGAVLRARPSAKAPVIMRLPSWTVLREMDENETGPWRSVRTPKGRKGVVLASQARSIIDYRLTFKPAGDRWEITALVAGD